MLVAVGGSDSWPQFSSTEFLNLAPGSQWRSGAGPVPEGRWDTIVSYTNIMLLAISLVL